MTKLLYFGSVPAPYQNEFWKECEKSINVLRIYLYSKQSGHDWKIKKTNNQRILEHNIFIYQDYLDFANKFTFLNQIQYSSAVIN